jgi:hypothetical protein
LDAPFYGASFGASLVKFGLPIVEIFRIYWGSRDGTPSIDLEHATFRAVFPVNSTTCSQYLSCDDNDSESSLFDTGSVIDGDSLAEPGTVSSDRYVLGSIAECAKPPDLLLGLSRRLGWRISGPRLDNTNNCHQSSCFFGAGNVSVKQIPTMHAALMGFECAHYSQRQNLEDSSSLRTKKKKKKPQTNSSPPRGS